MSNTAFYFRKALPVWESNREKEMNISLSFRTDIEKTDDPVILYATAACSFTVLVNDRLVAHGPARTAHEFYRVDASDLTPHLASGKNRVIARVTGYNIDSFSYLNQPSFFCAEVVTGDTVTAATGDTGFTAFRMPERVQRVQRYSYQRTFLEVYRVAPGAFGYESDDTATPVSLSVTESKQFLTRSAPYCDYLTILPKKAIGAGSVAYTEKDEYFKNRYIHRVTDTDNQFDDTISDRDQGGARERKFYSKGYPLEKLEIKSFVEVGMMDFTPEDAPASVDLSAIRVEKDHYIDLSMGANETGLFDFVLEAHEDTELYLLFDEILQDNTINPFRIGSSNIMSVSAKAGTYHIVSAEPYVLQYLRLIAKGGAVTIRDLRLIEIAFPMSSVNARFNRDDAQLKKIYDAAVRTFRANVVDVYMDCPSRERAGWLCDSFFTSRVEKVLSGKSDVELDFLEAFVLRDTFPTIQDKMLPMCYPSDHYAGNFIPNWAMWYVLELYEYLDRTGDRAFVDRAERTVLRLYEWFCRFENSDGLLEKLDGWVFVEWSRANKLVQDVSYASNMLYASFLDAIHALYGTPETKEKAERIRTVIRETTMVNGYFCDNAVRDESGKLVLSGECTEACQYYAFFCNVATPETHPALWETLVKDFGFDRRVTNKHPEIHFANAFIGNYLRLDLLRRYGYNEMLESNIRDYFTYMAECTGTLWEYEHNNKSVNHGFASHVLFWMDHLGYIDHI